MKKWTAIQGLAAICFLGVTATSYPADLFIMADGIDGGSTDEDHLKWSEAKALSGNVSRGNCGNFVVEKNLDKASLKFIEKSFAGEVIPEIVIENVETFGDGVRGTTEQISIFNALIKRVQTTKADGPLSESLTIVGDSVRLKFTEYSADGRKLGNVETEFGCNNKRK